MRRDNLRHLVVLQPRRDTCASCPRSDHRADDDHSDDDHKRLFAPLAHLRLNLQASMPKVSYVKSIDIFLGELSQ
jgi:hypothetical protein